MTTHGLTEDEYEHRNGGVPPAGEDEPMLTQETAQVLVDMMVTRLLEKSKPLLERRSRTNPTYERLYTDMGVLRIEAYPADPPKAPDAVEVGIMMSSLETCAVKYKAEGGQLIFREGKAHFTTIFATLETEAQVDFVTNELLLLFRVTKELICAAEAEEAQDRLAAATWKDVPGGFNQTSPELDETGHEVEPECPVPASFVLGLGKRKLVETGHEVDPEGLDEPESPEEVPVPTRPSYCPCPADWRAGDATPPPDWGEPSLYQW